MGRGIPMSDMSSLPCLAVCLQMLAAGLQPNLVTYNTLLEVYAKRGMWREAVGVLDTLEQQVSTHTHSPAWSANTVWVWGDPQHACLTAAFHVCHPMCQHTQYIHSALQPACRQ